MADALISVQYKGRQIDFNLSNVNLDEKRDALALGVGREVVDAIWRMDEGK